MVPRGVIISLLVTFVTVWATVKSRAAGTVSPPIGANVPWVSKTLRVSATRALLGFLLVLAIALILRVFLPTYSTVSSTLVMSLVAAFAAAIAYIMSYAAVLETGRIGKASGSQAKRNRGEVL